MCHDSRSAVCRTLTIRTEADYDEALQEIEVLFDVEPDTPEADRLDVLVARIEAYEVRHHAIPASDPIEAIEHELERRGMAPRDLEPFIDSRSRVREVLHRRRPLTLKMIRARSKGLDCRPLCWFKTTNLWACNRFLTGFHLPQPVGFPGPFGRLAGPLNHRRCRLRRGLELTVCLG